MSLGQLLRGSQIQRQMLAQFQALRLYTVQRILGAQVRPHPLVVVLAPVVDILRGLRAVLSHSQTQQLRQRMSQRVSQRISLGTGQCF